MRKFFLGLLGAIGGAAIGAPLLAMGLAVLFSEIYGTFEGAAAMAGVSLGGVGGLVLGAGLGAWLVLRKGGANAAVALAFSRSWCLRFSRSATDRGRSGRHLDQPPNLARLALQLDRAVVPLFQRRRMADRHDGRVGQPRLQLGVDRLCRRLIQ